MNPIGSRIANSILRCMLYSLLVVGLLVFALGASHYPILLRNEPRVVRYPAAWFEIGVILAVLAIAGAFLLLNASGNSIGDGTTVTWRELLVTSIAGGIALGLGLCFLVNGACDGGQILSHSTYITDLQMHYEGKGGTHYDMYVADWVTGGQSVDVHIDSATYYARKIGDPVTITTGPGRLGFEWVQRY